MMNAEDGRIIETLRRDGIAVLRDLLSEAELGPIRAEFDRVFLEQGKGAGEPGARDGVRGDALLACPNLAAVFAHPRIVAIAAAMLEEPEPWVWVLGTNRYTPAHVGVAKHSDGFLGELAPAFTRQSMAVFLDDIDESSGALTYVPGTHLLHYEDAGDPGKQPPTQVEIDGGAYVPATLKAGSVLLRVPEVWHAVNPIHRLRRYVTASYVARRRLSAEMTRRVTPERERRLAMSADHVPAELRPFYKV